MVRRRVILIKRFRQFFIKKEGERDPSVVVEVLKVLLFLVATVMLILSAFYVAGYPLLYFNNSQSATLGFYFIDMTPGYKYNDFVIVEYEKGHGELAPGSLLLKQIKGLPGDTYIRRDGELEVHGKRYPVVENPKLPQIPKGTYSILPDEMMLLNDKIGSFDGRYIGPIKTNKIRRKVFLIFNSEAFRNKERVLYEYLKGFWEKIQIRK